MSEFVNVIIAVFGFFVAMTLIAVTLVAVAYLWKVVAFLIGYPTGAIARHTPAERKRRAAADELAARDNTRPHGQLIDISTVMAPNGHESYFEDPS